MLTNNYGSGPGRPINLQLRIRNTVLHITFFYLVTSFRDEEYRTELEGGDEFIQVSVTSPHKVKQAHQRVLHELERTRLSPSYDLAPPPPPLRTGEGVTLELLRYRYRYRMQYLGQVFDEEISVNNAYAVFKNQLNNVYCPIYVRPQLDFARALYVSFFYLLSFFSSPIWTAEGRLYV
jgi:hypothetical protein